MDTVMEKLHTFITAHSNDQELSVGNAKFLYHSLKLVEDPFA
jgi:hypothetical protein